ncbi:MAG TPA: M1 family aminopeptidase [Burkholderiales bacterium]|nr:M1 family aminopeptidase [Burkholderiales bacterium]
MTLARTLGLAMLAAAAAPLSTGDCAAAAEPGVSRALARERAKRVGDLRYRFEIRIERGAARLTGSEEIRFVLHGGARAQRDLLLDWRPQAASGAAAGEVSGVRVNGRPLARPRTINEHLVIPARSLHSGENRVELAFAAPIGTAGTAVTRYADGEDGAEYLYTLFVPSDASSVFPCFDQPDLKGRFQLELTLPADWQAVGNAPLLDASIADGRKRLRFAETEPISSYLFAFAAGAFAEIADASGRARLWVRKSRLERARAEAAEVLRLNAAALRYFEDYFDRRFPFAKYDLVLLPEFPYGGMEHAGAAFLREDAVLFPSEPSPNDLLRRAQLLFHETTHQWFGDLVTMRWFDDLWLKEGFANFMAAKAAAEIVPQWRPWNAFHALKARAYRTDVTQGTTAIYQPLANLSAAKSAYGAIVYSKAPAVLRQAEFYLGEAAFKRAVRDFVGHHAYANATWADLVAAFERASGERLSVWAQAWVRRRGAPIVRAAARAAADGTVARFRLEQRAALGGDGAWPQRVELYLQWPDGRSDVIPVLLSGKTTAVGALTGRPAPRFSFANHGDYGYGVFLLDPASREALLHGLAAVPDEFLRALLWDALWESVRAAELAPEAYVELALRDLGGESDPVTVAGVLARVNVAFLRYLPDARRDAIAPRIEDVLVAAMLGSPALGLRITYFRAFVGIAHSAGARTTLKRLLDGSLEIPQLKLSSRDRFDIIAALTTLADADAPALLAAQSVADPSDEGRRYAYAAAAARPDAQHKRELFAAYLGDAALPERWIEDSLENFNDPRHAELTLPLLGRALAELPHLKATRKIFFVNDWLAAFVGGQSDARALALTRSFLRASRLDADLRRKVLEVADELERAVKIRVKFASG